MNAYLIITVIKVLLVFLVIMTAVAYYTLAERRFGAFMQDRLGPNRAGPLGLFQPLADGLKFFFKEEIIPTNADKWLYLAAPAFAMIPALITFAVVPFGNKIDKIVVFGKELKNIPLQIADINIGILYIFAIASLGLLGIMFGGWASNNKYSLLGALRAAAQMISYELSLGLSIIGILMIFGTLRLNEIAALQGAPLPIPALSFLPKWGIFMQPLGFIIFLIASFAETNRLPFDLPEGEAEIVAGYHTEYGAMKWAMFFMAEYSNMITSSAVITTLFFGGWQVPFSIVGFSPAVQILIGVLSFAIKTAFFAFMFIWVRWTLPRFRYDQLMHLGWKVLLPLAIFNIFATGAIYAFIIY